MKETDIAWLAGWLEGEGHFCIYKSQQRGLQHIRINATTTDLDVAKRASYLLNSSIFCEPPRKAGYKPAYRTNIAGSKAATVMRLILPYMGERRSAKIRECLQYYESHSQWSNKKWIDPEYIDSLLEGIEIS